MSSAKKSGWIKKLTLLLILSLTGLALFWAYQPAPILVETAKVQVAAFESTLRVEGETRVAFDYTLQAPVSGEIDRVSWRVGDVITLDDVLVIIRPQAPGMIDARSRSVLLAQIAETQAAEQAALARLHQAGVNLEQLRSTARRETELAAGGFISEAAREASQRAVSLAQAQEQAARADVNYAQQAVRAAQAMLQRAAEPIAPDVLQAASWALRSPIAGHVLAVPRRDAGPVTAGTPLLRIGQLEQLELWLDVLSDDALRIAVGQEVRLFAPRPTQSVPTSTPLSEDPFGRLPITGQVVRIEPVARTQVSTLGVEEQRVWVVAEFTGAAPTAWGDRYRIQAEVIVERQESVVQVPLAALTRAGSGWQVHRITSETSTLRVQPTPVTVAARNRQTAWISDGLSEGQEVVLFPPAGLQAGTRVARRASPQEE